MDGQDRCGQSKETVDGRRIGTVHGRPRGDVARAFAAAKPQKAGDVAYGVRCREELLKRA